MGNPARFGSGARSEPQDVPGGSGTGRREAPFGPEISWPYGFRPLDPESREVLESAYGTGPLNTSYGSGSGYQPSAMDDYGDPGYSDPSYDGPGLRRPHLWQPQRSARRSRVPGQPGVPQPARIWAAAASPAALVSPAGSGGFGTPRGFGGDSRRPSGDWRAGVSAP